MRGVIVGTSCGAPSESATIRPEPNAAPLSNLGGFAAVPPGSHWRTHHAAGLSEFPRYGGLIYQTGMLRSTPVPQGHGTDANNHFDSNG
jgi:hypothetical protein